MANAKVKSATTVKHELAYFDPCTFGDGGFYYHDGADRAVCTCGWKSAASRDQKALVALFDLHQRSTREDTPR